MTYRLICVKIAKIYTKKLKIVVINAELLYNAPSPNPDELVASPLVYISCPLLVFFTIK